MDRFVPVKQLDLTHEAFPDKFIFGTEACIDPTQNILLPHVVLGSFDRAEAYAKYIIQDLNHWVTGWTDWNLALDLKGGPNWANNFVDAPVIVNATADEFYKQPMFYIMGHFSKFIPEGSVRINISIESKINNSKISHVAFVNQQLRQTILVLFNG
jgi:glucosylceramidase